MMYLVSGTKIYTDEQYGSFNWFVATMLQNFNNAIGSVEMPDSSFWKYERRTHIVWRETLMDIYGWSLFLFNEFVMLLVLLNFVIAVITDSYTSVIERQSVRVY